MSELPPITSKEEFQLYFYNWDSLTDEGKERFKQIALASIVSSSDNVEELWITHSRYGERQARQYWFLYAEPRRHTLSIGGYLYQTIIQDEIRRLSESCRMYQTIIQDEIHRLSESCRSAAESYLPGLPKEVIDVPAFDTR